VSNTLPAPQGPPSPEQEVIWGRDSTGRVFISSQMKDSHGRKVYEDERAKLAADIDAIPFLKPWLWERNAPVGDYSSEDVCLGAAGTADCLVLIVGRELTPITRREYETARAAKAHCFIFQDTRVEPDATVTDFIKAERKLVSTGKFSSAEDLARQAVEHLQGRALHSMRQVIVSGRGAAAQPAPIVEDRSAAWSEPPARRRYEEQQVALGEFDSEDSFRTVAEIVAEQRGRAESGEYETAFNELRDLADALYAGGRADLALEVIEDLRAIVPPGRMTPVDDAWTLNAQALALARVGKGTAADELWRRMLAVGDSLGDKPLRAVAMQNLAITALTDGELEQAKQMALGSVKLMRELEELRPQLQLLNTLALVAIEESDYDKAGDVLDVYEGTARELGDLHLLTSAHANRGQLLVAQGRFKDAEREFREALRLARKTEEPVSEVLGLQNLGAVCADEERFGEAMRWYRKGVRLAETYELPVQVEALRRSLGTVLHGAGRNREAIAEFDQARKVAWELGDQHLWAQSTMNMAALYCRTGNPTAAMDPLERAASTFRELGDLEWELNVQRNMAAVRRQLRALDVAMDVLEAGLALLPAAAHEDRAALLREAAETGLEDPDLLARSVELFERALVEEAAYLSPGDLARRTAMVASFLSLAGEEEALPFFDRCVAQLEECAAGEYGLADALNDRAVGLERLGRHDAARADLVRCVELTEDGSDDVLRQKALANLSEVERQLEDIPASVSAALSALQLARQLGDDEAMAHAIGNLSLALEDDDRPDEADAALQELKALADAQDVPAWQARAASGFGRLAFVRGEYERAAAHYQAAVRIYETTGSENVVFALGGLLESLGRAGQQDGLQDAVQQLIDRVKAGEDPELVIGYLGRTGVSWLALGDLEAASSMLGIAALVGVQTLGDGELSEEDVQNGVRPLAHALGFVVLAAQGSTEFDDDEVYEAVVTYVDNQHAGNGDALRPFLLMMRDAMPPPQTS